MTDLHHSSYCYGVHRGAEVAGRGNAGSMGRLILGIALLSLAVWAVVSGANKIDADATESARKQIHAEADMKQQNVSAYEAAMVEALAPPKPVGKKLSKNATSGIKINGGSK